MKDGGRDGASPLYEDGDGKIHLESDEASLSGLGVLLKVCRGRWDGCAWTKCCLGGFARSRNSTGVVFAAASCWTIGRVLSCRIDRLGVIFGDGHGYEIRRQTIWISYLCSMTLSRGPVCIRLYSQCSADSAEQDNCRHGARSCVRVAPDNVEQELPPGIARKGLGRHPDFHNGQHLSTASSKPVWASGKDFFTKIALLKI